MSEPATRCGVEAMAAVILAFMKERGTFEGSEAELFRLCDEYMRDPAHWPAILAASRELREARR